LSSLGLFQEATEVEPEKGEALPLEQACDQYREGSFATTEYVSKHWGHKVQEKANAETFRITVRGEWSFLEELRHGKGGPAYHWSGLMYLTENQHELTGVMVKASRGLAK